MAAWLLLGSAALWFVGLLQPCAEGLIGSARAADRVAAAPHAAADSAAFAHGDNEIACTAFLDVQAVPVRASIGFLPAPDASGKWFAVPSRRPERRTAHRGDRAPPSSFPVYLRTLRLLI
jgi:hypothetical protein